MFAKKISHPAVFNVPAEGFPCNFITAVGIEKKQNDTPNIHTVKKV